MEKYEGPQIIYKGKRPQGYRVGIGINGAYGICPFCKKPYTKEQLEKSLEENDPNKQYINFEHIYPRFAIKAAISEQKKFREMEYTLLVAVHKDCNTKGKELENTLKKLISSVNKDGEITPQHAEKVLQYCRKTSAFLHYLTDWENVTNDTYADSQTEQQRYEIINIAPDRNLSSTLTYDNYKDFSVYLGGVVFTYRCFTNKDDLNDFLIQPELYDNSPFTITIVSEDNKLYYAKYKLMQHNPYGFSLDIVPFNKNIYWKLGKTTRWSPNYHNALGFLPQSYNRLHIKEHHEVNPLLKKRLSLGGDYRDGIDDDIFFVQNGEIYVYQNGIKLKLKDSSNYSSYFLNNMGLYHLPDMSKHIIESHFICDLNELTTLEGAPKHVNGTFACSNNKLITLKGRPEYVGLDFYCQNNLLKTLEDTTKEENGTFEVKRNFDCAHNKLIALKGAPEQVGGWFQCSHNKLTSLKDGPTRVDGGYNCSHNELTTLEGAPERVSAFSCSNNKLTSLEFAPKYVDGFFNCANNQLTTLKGGPTHVKGIFDCRQNRLTTLTGAPQYVERDLVCWGNELRSLDCSNTVIGGVFLFDAKYLESLAGLPTAKSYLVNDCKKTFNTADALCSWFAEYKKERDSKKTAHKMRAGTKIINTISNVLDTKNKIHHKDQHEM